MGCSSSKPIPPEEKRVSEKVSLNEVVNVNLSSVTPLRTHSSRSKDSGIESHPSEINEADSNYSSSRNLLEHAVETTAGKAITYWYIV